MTRKMKALTTLAAAAALFAALPALPARCETVATAESSVLKVGASAPVFTLKSMKGEEYRLGDRVGKKPVLMFFWSIFCGPCREEMPVLQKAWEKYGTDKLDFVGVNIDGKVNKALEKFTADSGFSFTTLMDEMNNMVLKVADPYGVIATPITYIVDKDGKIAYVGVGKAEEADLEAALDKVMGH